MPSPLSLFPPRILLSPLLPLSLVLSVSVPLLSLSLSMSLPSLLSTCVASWSPSVFCCLPPSLCCYLFFPFSYIISHAENFSFDLGREHAPSIIFMDEIDSIGSARMESGTGNGDSEVQRTMLELLNQLDGFEASNKIKVHCIIFQSNSLSA